jgi:hypothetical protein
VYSGGNEAVTATGTLAHATIDGAGTIMLGSGAVDTSPITFVSSGGTFVWGFGAGGTLGPELAGFGLGDTLDLKGLAFVSGTTATLHGLVNRLFWHILRIGQHYPRRF